MKKNLAKFLAIVMVVSVLAFSGIPMFAFTHTQSGYGTGAGTDGGYSSWSLNVNSYFASANGAITPGYTGSVYCYVQVTGDEEDSTAANSNAEILYGNGLSATVTLYNYVKTQLYLDKNVVQAGAGSKGGSYNHANWSLTVTGSYAASHGWMDFGYTDTIQCDCFVEGNSGNATALDDCSYDLMGVGESAEVWFY